jgi:hypothetical protein
MSEDNDTKIEFGSYGSAKIEELEDQSPIYSAASIGKTFET